jgi:hypothetical protein
VKVWSAVQLKEALRSLKNYGENSFASKVDFNSSDFLPCAFQQTYNFFLLSFIVTPDILYVNVHRLNAKKTAAIVINFAEKALHLPHVLKLCVPLSLFWGLYLNMVTLKTLSN